MLSKLAKVNGSWKWIVFSDEEEKEIRDKHRVQTSAIFASCMKDAEAFVDKEDTLSLVGIASALFSKRADAIYSALQKEVDQAICNMQKEAK